MNLNSKDILAKLLATENVTVTHRNAQTASFNVRDRVLTLPMWDNMESYTYDHLVGHEVGHALYTPEAGWHEAVCSHGKAYKSFLNVVEDARIEKMIQARYPGLRRSFVSSYKKMLADGFFGGDIDLINTYDLIDRINTYFKVGRSAGVRIERSELPWIREIEALETWDEVVDVTDRLYAFCENVKKDELYQLEELMSSPENQPEEHGQGEDEGYDDFEGEESEDSEESEESESADTGVDNAEEFAPGGFEDDDSMDQSPFGDEKNETAGGDLSSKTDETLRQYIASEHGDTSNIIFTNITLNNAPVAGLIVDYKHIINEIMSTDSTDYDQFSDAVKYYQALENKKGLRLGKAKYKKFLLENKKTVNYMVKEFEMKKSAAAYSRQTTSKTGVIDPIKMNSYLYNDDIFRKVSTTLDGKNHGMLMYIDWSGSMSNDLTATIEQLLNLVLFCRQVNIPYSVYAFTDRFPRHAHTNALSAHSTPIDYTLYNQTFRLMELFTSNMNREDFNTMAEILLAIGDFYCSRNSYRLWCAPEQLFLGATPLDDCIIAAMQIHGEFKAKTRVDVVNTIFLTDGDSHHTLSKTEGGAIRVTSHFNFSGDKCVMYFVDPITKKRYKVLGHNCNITSTLLKMYRDRTKSTTIGYRIMSPNWSKFRNQMPNVIRLVDGMELCKKMRLDHFTILPPTLGYDKCFAIAGGRFLSTSNGAIEVEDDASVGKIRTAFKKANSSRKGSRKMLSDLVETIS